MTTILKYTTGKLLASFEMKIKVAHVQSKLYYGYILTSDRWQLTIPWHAYPVVIVINFTARAGDGETIVWL